MDDTPSAPLSLVDLIDDANSQRAESPEAQMTALLDLPDGRVPVPDGSAGSSEPVPLSLFDAVLVMPEPATEHYPFTQ